MTTERLARLRAGDLFATDGGLETVLLFHEGIDLPHFAAFDLLRSPEGAAALRAYYDPYLRLARERGVGFVVETPTWRASPDWARLLGYGPDELEGALRAALALAEDVRAAYETDATPVLVSGNLGPRGDGYSADDRMMPDDAERYHAPAIGLYARGTADLVHAMTMTHVEEAIGIVRAAEAAGVPAAISFTVETDGRLPSGQELGAAIEEVDAATGGAALHFGVNCAHPTHFAATVAQGGAWRERIRSLRANASTMSHEELDNAEELDEGDPADLGARHAELLRHLPKVNVVGGCCGTDHRHVEQVVAAVA